MGYLVKLICRNFGFDCDFKVEDPDSITALEKFGNHTILEHGKKFSQESLMQFFLRSGASCPYCNSHFETNEQLSKHIDKIHHGSGLLEGDTRNF